MRFGVLFDGRDGRKRLLAEDGIGGQHARLPRTKAIQRDLAATFAHLVHPHYAGDEQRNGIDAAAFHEYLRPPECARKRLLPKVADQRRVGGVQKRQMGIGEIDQVSAWASLRICELRLKHNRFSGAGDAQRPTST